MKHASTLDDIDFAWLPRSWESAQRAAGAIFHETGMNVDQANLLQLSKDLLSVLLLTALREGSPNMRFVEILATEMDCNSEMNMDHLLDPDVPTTGVALTSIKRVSGSWFCEPVKFVVMNIKDGNAKQISRQLRNSALLLGQCRAEISKAD